MLVKGLQLGGWITYLDARTRADAAFPAAVGKNLPQLPHLRGAATATWTPTPALAVTVAGRYSGRSFGTIDDSDPHANTYMGFGAFFVMDVHARYRFTPHVSGEVGVDNLNDRAYFEYHPFTRRTVIGSLKYAW